jgi:hypothetical protein
VPKSLKVSVVDRKTGKKKHLASELMDIHNEGYRRQTKNAKRQSTQGLKETEAYSRGLRQNAAGSTHALAAERKRRNAALNATAKKNRAKRK